MSELPGYAHRTPIERPVAREPLHLKTARRIRVMIVQGTLAPGSRVMEHKLCQQFGVSRTPLREALKVLAAEGLVQLKHSKGTWVAPMEPEQIGALFEVIEPLGRKVGDLAALRAEEEHLADLETLCQTLAERSAGAEGGDNRAFLGALWEGHLLLGRMTKNRALLRAYQECLVKILRACHHARLQSEERDRWVADLDAICDSLGEAESDGHGVVRSPVSGAGAALAAHWRHVEQAVMSGLAVAAERTPAPVPQGDQTPELRREANGHRPEADAAALAPVETLPSARDRGAPVLIRQG